MALSNQVVPSNVANLPTLNTAENTFRVLQETLYPGSTDQEVAMILSYCLARRIDPVLKPVHLVPMSVKTDKKDAKGKFIYERKNVIMPGIGLYRIDASRSGQYAGVDEPQFGEDVTEEFISKDEQGRVSNSVKITYPLWCKITARKLLPNGEIALFTAKEYWKENFASKSKWDNTPNDMWSKRPYGQLAKCAEAQVLRKAFPDVVGNEYTKEEMEGKNYHHDDKPQAKQSRTFEHEKAVDHQPAPAAPVEPRDLAKDLLEISWADTIDKLQEVYKEAYKYWMKLKVQENMNQLIAAKDKRRDEIEAELAKINPETGEISE